MELQRVGRGVRGKYVRIYIRYSGLGISRCSVQRTLVLHSLVSDPLMNLR